MSNRSVVAAVSLVALSVAALTGCAADAAPAADDTPSAAPPSNAPSATPTSAPEPTAEAGSGCVMPGGDGMIMLGEPLNLGLYAHMKEYGARVGANGAVSYAPDGSLASYEVAPDDYKDAILERFCVGYYSLDALNAVRRGGSSSVDAGDQAYSTALYVGDTLNLSPYTITSVGDVNGEVHSFETSFVLPPQR